MVVLGGGKDGNGDGLKAELLMAMTAFHREILSSNIEVVVPRIE